MHESGKHARKLNTNMETLKPIYLSRQLNITTSAANMYECAGSITIPPNCFFAITAKGMYNNAVCNGVVMANSDVTIRNALAAHERTSVNEYYPSCTYASHSGSSGQTIYLWGCWQGAGSKNSVIVTGFYIKTA